MCATMGGVASATTDRRAVRRALVSAQIEQTALELFESRGFDDVTVDEVAAAAGVGRRTFFRYFPSKHDVVLGGLDDQLERMRDALRHAASDASPVDSIRTAFLAVNDYRNDELPVLRIRMRLVMSVPDLAAHSALRYQDWERALSDHVADRVGRGDALYPATLARAAIGVMQAVFAIWLDQPERELRQLINGGFEHLATGFARP